MNAQHLRLKLIFQISHCLTYILEIDLTGMSKKIVAHYLDPLEYINILGSLKMFLTGKVPLMTY